jgi:hypothetical protein
VSDQRENPMSRPSDFGLREDYEGWLCTCGARLYPDCDISAASVGEEFMSHLGEHGFSVAEIEEELALTDTARRKP